jgi:hypothetical protein
LVDASIESAAFRPAEFRIGDALGRSFSILGRNFVPFIIVAAILTLPNLYFLWTQPAAGGIRPNMAFRLVLSGAVGGLFRLLTEAVITYGAFQVMLGRTVRIGESFRRAGARLLPVLGLILIEGVVIGLASMLLVIPGLIVITMWYVSLPACVVEGLSPIKSLSRSAALTKGHRWRIFGVLMLMFFASLIIGGVVGGVIGGIGGATGALSQIRVPLVTAQYVVQTLMVAYSAILTVVIYHDLRVGREGVDTERIAAVFD